MPFAAILTRLTFLLLLFVPALADAQQPAATTVIVVRHAERADDGTQSDPELGEAGRARALALAEALGNAGVRVIFTTQFTRTRQTAEPLAARLGVPVLAIEARPGGSDGYIAALRAALSRELPEGGVAVVVGHSNTVPAIAAALSGLPVAAMSDAEYATMYLITLPAAGPPSLVRARYGAPDTTEGEIR
jgi:broad specificity phosphatase PhoE